MGVVLGSWQLAYVGCAFAAGLALDRFGVRRTMAAGALMVGVSAIARAFAIDFVTLALAVGLFGVGGPMISIGSNKVVSEWFRGRQRGTALAIATTAPTVGSVLVLALANSVLVPALGGWRNALFACGVVSVAAALAWLALARETPRWHNANLSGATQVSIRTAVLHLVRLGNVRLVLAGAVGTFMLSHGLSNWLPTLLVNRDFSVADSGFWAAASTALGLPSGLVLPRSAAPGQRRYLVAALSLTSALAVLGMAFWSGAPLLIALAALGLARAGATPLMMLILMDMREIGAARTGAAAGLYFTFGEIGGFGGPFLVGVLRELTGSFAIPLAILAGLQLVLAGLALRLVERESASGYRS
jgi:cyanate permease